MVTKKKGKTTGLHLSKVENNKTASIVRATTVPIVPSSTHVNTDPFALGTKQNPV